MSAPSRRPRRAARIVAASTVGTVVLALLALMLGQYWTGTASDRGFVDAERHGVVFLRPLTRLLDELTLAQSAAVRGGAVDDATVRAAAADTDAADRTVGGDLQAHQRWADLRTRVTGLLGDPGTGPVAYQRFSEVIAVAADLLARVTDVSKLILDPELDSYYLMDIAALRLPAAMVSAGRVADLVSLGGGGAVPLAAQPATAVAIARYQVALAASQISSSFKKSADATGRSTLGSDLTVQQDAFQAAVDQLAPPVVVSQLSQPADLAALAGAARAVQSTALALATATLDRLDSLLAARQDRITRGQQVILGGSAGTVAGVLLLLWLFLPVRRDGTGDDEPPAEPAQPEPVGQLIDARTLLGAEELVHVGRAVRPRVAGGEDDDAR